MKFIAQTFGAMFLLGLLGGCDSPYVSYPQAAAMAGDKASATRFLANTTVKSYSRPHGTQYEFLAADGTTSLIYPGNSRPVNGRWAVIGEGEFGAEMCFMYGANTYNPVTKVGGGAWECEPLIGYLYRLQEIYDGDVFQVKGQKTFARPFRAREDISILTALKERGLPQPKGPNKALSKESK